jgi:acetyltransferase-like isoleucine patch superfamily enzyme
MSWLTYEQLSSLGFKKTGKNVFISDKASFYNTSNIEIGDNVRIDDFVVFSAGEGGIKIGNFIHIAVFASIIGKGEVVISDFSNISSKVAIYSSNDDYSGEFMTNPMVSEEFTNVTNKRVFLGKHVIIGSGSVILPGVTIEDGVAVGALSLVKNDCKRFSVYAGIPAKRIGKRKKKLLILENSFLKTLTNGE